MQASFNKLAEASLSEAEQALNDWGIQYEKRPDGTLFVPVSLDISGRDLTRLPDLSSVVVNGSFSCHNNQLTSLKGAPQSVGGDFNCMNNHLTSLEGAPPSVGRVFDCSRNQLTSLKGAPNTVGNSFKCSYNFLTSLEYSPPTVSSTFLCDNNQLTSLKGAPLSTGTIVFCHNNPLVSLEYAPQNFKMLKSDLGCFAEWKDIPEELRTSPGEYARLQEERATQATVLQYSLRVGIPLKLRSNLPAHEKLS